ncbi:CHAD domain-containing protein [bacterium]|nr:CHAD domain-containing protein [bacterium]
MFPGTAYCTTRAASAEKLLADLGLAFTLVPAEELRFRVLFSDTFDWALHRAGWALEIQGSGYRLLDRVGGKVIAAAVESSAHAPRFAWEFADPRLRSLLEPRLKLRALVGILTVAGRGRRFTLRNRHGELVGRCDLTTLQLERGERDEPFLVVCSFGTLPADSPLAIQAARLCRESGWEEAPPVVLDRALGRARIVPGAYSSKMAVSLDPALSTREAARRIARNLTGVMRANLPGIRKDVDTEFLHDFRVAVRRTRSLLKLLDAVIPDGVLEEFVPVFRNIGRATGPLRDLDVYLLKRGEYGALVPPVLHPGLEDYFSELGDRRREALTRLTEYLDGPEFLQALDRWEAFLSLDPAAWPGGADLADPPVGLTARREIERLYRQVLRRGKRVTREGKDRSFHRLRIRCKELRYALEFFASLFPGTQHGQVVRRLKTLQDDLGEFNDLCVQMAHLEALLEGKADRPIPGREAATLGALILQMHQRKQAVGERFAGTFAGFSRGKNRRMIKAMLA